MAKIGRNDPCPCGIRKKYKQCCWGTVDWEDISKQSPEALVRHLSTRGKNKLFLSLALSALQLDNPEKVLPFKEFKRAFTSEAVQKIYEALAFVWPDGEDLKRVLHKESDQTSGLYIGHYDQKTIERGITRHSLYADRILLVDPMLHPARLREDFNPLVHPEQHRTNTLKWMSLWFDLMPWIEEGLIGFVRAPSDFYPEVMLEAASKTQARFQRHPEFKNLSEEMVAGELGSEDYQHTVEDLMLSHSDDYLRKLARDADPQLSSDKLEELIAHLHDRRDRHPYHLGPETEGVPMKEFRHVTTGTNYEQAKMIAHYSLSYVMTDMPLRWREIEVDRADSGIDPQEWSPFAKAFQGLPFQFLNSVPLDAALAIRKEGRLESLRSFLRKTWNGTSRTTSFGDANIANLAAELEDKVREAEVEWRKIDTELLQYVSAETAVALGGSMVASGHVQWLGAAAMFAANLVHSTMKRRTHKLEYPAGFFVDLRDGRYK